MNRAEKRWSRFYLVVSYCSQILGAYCAPLFEQITKVHSGSLRVREFYMNLFIYACITSGVILIGFKYPQIFAYVILIAYIVLSIIVVLSGIWLGLMIALSRFHNKVD